MFNFLKKDEKTSEKKETLYVEALRSLEIMEKV
jgi:hypothetical protein